MMGKSCGRKPTSCTTSGSWAQKMRRRRGGIFRNVNRPWSTSWAIPFPTRSSTENEINSNKIGRAESPMRTLKGKHEPVGPEGSGFAKTLVVLAGIFLVASGMCGMQWIIGNGRLRGDYLLPLGLLELIAMLL